MFPHSFPVCVCERQTHLYNSSFDTLRVHTLIKIIQCYDYIFVQCLSAVFVCVYVDTFHLQPIWLKSRQERTPAAYRILTLTLILFHFFVPYYDWNIKKWLSFSWRMCPEIGISCSRVPSMHKSNTSNANKFVWLHGCVFFLHGFIFCAIDKT